MEVENIFIYSFNFSARVFSLTWTLPKCISFLRMGRKETAVISKVFGILDYESEVRMSKFKMADPI